MHAVFKYIYTQFAYSYDSWSDKASLQNHRPSNKNSTDRHGKLPF